MPPLNWHKARIKKTTLLVNLERNLDGFWCIFKLGFPIGLLWRFNEIMQESIRVITMCSTWQRPTNALSPSLLFPTDALCLFLSLLAKIPSSYCQHLGHQSCKQGTESEFGLTHAIQKCNNLIILTLELGSDYVSWKDTQTTPSYSSVPRNLAVTQGNGYISHTSQPHSKLGS